MAKRKRRTKKVQEIEWKRGRRGDNLVAERMVYEDRSGRFRLVRVRWLGPRGRDENGRLINYPDDWEAMKAVRSPGGEICWTLLGRRRQRSGAERLCQKAREGK